LTGSLDIEEFQEQNRAIQRFVAAGEQIC